MDTEKESQDRGVCMIHAHREVGSLSLYDSEECSCIQFNVGGKDPDWLIKIQRKKDNVVILFNKEKYPDALPDDFANKFAEILIANDFIRKFITKRLVV